MGDAKKESKADLRRRVAELESIVATHHGGNPSGNDPVAQMAQCAVPMVRERELSPSISAQRERLIRYMARKWVNGTILHYYFFDSGPFGGDQVQQDIVRDGFDIWKQVGIGLEFEETDNIGQAEVRIGFLPGDGYWSYVGTDVLTTGQHERTMNFGYDLTADPRGADVAVHEIGHTLGFPHEHQNPNAGIVWNEPEVIRVFSGPPNSWDEATIRHNILRKIPSSQVDGSDWDPDSIMHYAFPPGLIEVPEVYRTSALRPAAGLSTPDQEQVRAFYPANRPSPPELRLFESVVLELEPGEQADFVIRPPATRDYTIQTLGYTDSVMVLFEDQGGGNYVFVEGDDDSGWDRNATVQARLHHDRTYIVRVRLYYAWASGQMAVVYW